MRTSNTLFLAPTHNTFTPKSNFFRPFLSLLSSLLVLLSVFNLSTLAQVDCVDPGGIATVNVSATAGAAGPYDFTATLPLGAGHTIIPNSCTATVGGVATPTCTVAPNGQSVTWSGTIPAGSILDITYRVQVSATATNGPVTITNSATSFTFPATSGFVVGCAVLTATSIPSARVSDQKPGSVLAFPYYTSGAPVPMVSPNDTRISITHSSAPGARVYDAFVHVFLIEGTSCAQLDFFVCLTRGASFVFNTSAMDPDMTGYIIAVAVNGMGLPIQNNVLIGNAFVNTPDYYGNYGAESFAANSANLYTDYGPTARLYFDGIGYDAVPKEFTVEIQSPVDVPSPFQKIVVAGMIGDLSTSTMSGAAQVMAAQVINDTERAVASFSRVVSGGCQTMGNITATTPRVGGGMAALIPAGRSGTIKFKVGGGVGLLLTPRNTTWGGIRTLHKTATVATSLTIPIFMPTCPPL